VKITAKCVGCGQCKPFCPVDAIETCGISTINEDCIDCGKCKGYCPLRAIADDSDGACTKESS